MTFIMTFIMLGASQNHPEVVKRCEEENPDGISSCRNLSSYSATPGSLTALPCPAMPCLRFLQWCSFCPAGMIMMSSKIRHFQLECWHCWHSHSANSAPQLSLPRWPRAPGLTSSRCALVGTSAWKWCVLLYCVKIVYVWAHYLP